MYYATDKKGFNKLLNQANKLLGFPDGNGTDNYCEPIIDKDGVYYFTINTEVESLVDESKLVDYDSIDITQPKI